MEAAGTVTDLENSEIDMDRISSHMSRYGGGQISLVNRHWSEGIAIIEIDNVHKSNAISGKMMVDFQNCIAKLESWTEGKAVIVHGIGNNFCSGADLDFARTCDTPKDGFYLSTLMNDVLRRLENLPLVSVALVHGATVGGGAEVAMACDFILAAADTRYGFVHGKMGIITAWGATTRLVRAVGRKQALELLLTSKILTAEECRNIGLVSDIVNDKNKLEECLEWTRARTKYDYSITRAFKQAVIAQSRSTLEESIDMEKKLFFPLWGGPANREALAKKIKHVKYEI